MIIAEISRGGKDIADSVTLRKGLVELGEGPHRCAFQVVDKALIN